MDLRKKEDRRALVAIVILVGCMVFNWYLTNKAASFLYVVDGDTIKVEYMGKKESLRLFGIDAPESTTLRYGHAESGGVEATAHLKDIMRRPGEIDIEIKDYRDVYGRLLGTVYLEGENVNQAMVEDGFARDF